MHRDGDDEPVVEPGVTDPVFDTSRDAPRLPSSRWAIWLFLISTALVVVLGPAVQALDPALGLVFTELALILAPAVVAAWWQLLAAAVGLTTCLLLMGRAGRRSTFPAPPIPARPTVFAVVAVLMVVGSVVALPRYLGLLRWQHVLGRDGTIQFDHYRMLDDYSFRKESNIVPWGDGVALWTDGGPTLSIPRGDGFISAEIGGEELRFELLPESAVGLTLPGPPAAGTVLRVVCEGRLEPDGPHRFPSHPFVPVIAIRATVDLRDAPALRFVDSSYRVKTPMFLIYPRFVDASDGVGWVEVPLVGSSGHPRIGVARPVAR